jgi:hypothetical protein
MKSLIPLVAAASIVAGAVLVGAQREAGSEVESPPSSSSDRFASDPGDVAGGRSESAMERLERSIRMKAGTKRSLGEFELADGRRLRLYSADTTDAKSCLIDVDPEAGPGAGCLENGLFHARKVAFSVNTQGGPERFDELYLVGVVAPSVRGVTLVKTDGGAAQLRLNPERAFLFQSAVSDLESGIYPTALRLYGPSGDLVETVAFPPAG